MSLPEANDELNVTAERSPQIEKTVYRLKKLSDDERARLLHDAYEKERRDNRAREKGAWLEGIKIGLEKSLRSSEEEGIKIGERNALNMLVKKMLKRYVSVDEIVEITGLTFNEVESLRDTI